MADGLLADTLRALPEIPGGARARPDVVLDEAERHGLAGVVYDAMLTAGVPLEPRLAQRLAQRKLARELDHAAHLALLGEIDEALTRAAIPAVALKGPLLAERLYPHPAARATSDVDLLVAEERLDDALRALATVGYDWSASEEETRFRQEHHHLHLARAGALPVELHFHAYRGFGTLLPSAPLIERRRAMAPFRTISVLQPSDELVYLAVHAAAHRFVRLGWLWDLRLLIAQLDERDLAIAEERARAWGYARVMSVAKMRLEPFVDGSLAPLGSIGSLRRGVVTRVADEPARPLVRAATRFIYTVALCDSPSNAWTYAVAAIRDRWSR